MAIKGKKKSGSRGSQARRRPASAPRPVAVSRRREPWYDTAVGRVAAAVLVVLVLSGIGIAIAINRSNASDRKERLEAVEGYTGELSTIAQAAATPAGQMSLVTPTAGAEQLETLPKASKQWVTDLEAAASRVTALVPPEEVDGINPYFTQSLQLYVGSARVMGDAARAEGKLRRDLLTRAAEIRAQAEGVFTNAVRQLDEASIELGGDPSGIQSPAMAGAATVPQPGAPAEGGGGGQGGGGGG